MSTPTPKLMNKAIVTTKTVQGTALVLLLGLFDKKLLNLPVRRLLDMMTEIDRAQERYLGACPWTGVLPTLSIT